MARIINMYANKKAVLPLTPSMIKTLRVACDKQSKNETLTQNNLKGSFVVLVNRGLIDCRQFTLNGESEMFWYVTNKGILALNDVDKIKNAN